MGRVSAAFRIFFRTLGSRELADQVEHLLAGERLPAIGPTVAALPGQAVAGHATAAQSSAAQSSPKQNSSGAVTAKSAPSGTASSTHGPVTAAPPAKPQGIEALTLLSTLQREARLIDFLKEDLSRYTDDQVGGAVRQIHHDAAATLERLFALAPVLDQPEGSQCNVSASDAARFRLTGAVQGAGPHRGELRHHGWQAGKVEIPEFSGTVADARIVAPAEVEVMR